MSQYPRQLLPRKEYSNLLDINILAEKVPNLTVVRRSDQPIRCLDGTTILDEDCITKNVFDYSMNLLGGGFDAYRHIKFRQTGAGNDKWDGKKHLSDEDIDHSYCILGNAYPIFFMVTDINHVTLPYKKKYNRKKEMTQSLKSLLSDAEMKRYEDTWEKGKYMEFKGEMTVVHAPTMMNYWHVELKIIEIRGTHKTVKQGNAAWKEIIRNAVIQHLSGHYLNPTKVKDYVIPVNLYMKAPSHERSQQCP